MSQLQRKIQVPGEPQSAHELTDSSAFQSDPDAAVALGQTGRARKIEKPRVEVPPVKLVTADDTRPQSANINAKAGMSAPDAMALDRKGKLTRPVLTPDGWYCPRNSPNERTARRKAGAAEMIDID
jgi:hypothetical protein